MRRYDTQVAVVTGASSGIGRRVACDLAPARFAPDAFDDRPRLTEPWFCCAEPTVAQLGRAEAF